MKQSLIKTVFISVVILVLLFSFTNSNVITITINSPNLKSSYKVRDTVWIKADLSSTEALHNVYIRVINLKDSAVVYSKHIHSHSSNLHIEEYYINPVGEKSEMQLSISTTGHEGEETARTDVKFICQAKKR